MSLGLLRAIFIADPLIVLATIVMGLINLAVSFFDHDGRKQIGLARTWARMLLLFAGVKVRVEGLEKIDPSGSYVFASNHASYMDTPVVLAQIPVQFRFLAKIELFKIPLLGDHLKRAGHIPVPRDDPRAAVKTLGEAARAIQERAISLLIFPEGGRTLTDLQAFKEGAAYIAIKAGVPVVPLGLTGTLAILPRGSINVRSGHVTVSIGDPIPTKGLTLRDRGTLTEQLHQRVAELLGQPSYTQTK
jgi:1-acyl-sn-glycerol-3-phosphate acyltransferase